MHIISVMIFTFQSGILDTLNSWNPNLDTLLWKSWLCPWPEVHHGYFADNLWTDDFLRKNLKENVDPNKSNNSPSNRLRT